MKAVKRFLVSLFLLSLLIPSRFVHAGILTQSTITQTITSSFTITASLTPWVTRTSTPSATPIIVTVIHTRIVTRLAPTLTPTATATSTVTIKAPSTGNDETDEVPMSPYSVAIVGMIATFIAGLVVGTIWSSLTRRTKG